MRSGRQRKRVANTTAAMRRALEQLRRAAGVAALRFATEEVGGNAAALMRLLAGQREIVYLAQPLRVHRFHLALGQPHKSDPYDAQVIATPGRSYRLKDKAQPEAAELSTKQENTKPKKDNSLAGFEPTGDTPGITKSLFLPLLRRVGLAA